LLFSVKADIYGVVGGIFILYGMAGYPAIARKSLYGIRTKLCHAITC